MFLKAKDLEKERGGSIFSQVANTGLGLVSCTSEEIQWNSNDLGVVTVRSVTPRYFYYYYHYYYY
jgi:hypothetical protein